MMRRPGYRCRQAPESSAYKLISVSVPKFLLCCTLVVGLTPLSAFARLFGNSDTTVVSNQFQITAPEADVLEAVRHVSQDEIVHGTYVYEKEKTLRGAQTAKSSNAFRDEKPAGEVFYKVAKDVLDPRHFKGSNGVGTLAVRYVVNARGADETSLRIDAVFVEEERRRADKSDGTVESAEYDAVRSQVESIQQARLSPAVEAQHAGGRPVAPTPVASALPQPNTLQPATASTFPPLTASAGPQPSTTLSPEAFKDLQQRVAELRSQVEGQIKSNGTALRQAPISRSTTVDTLPAASAVVILVITPKWYGVETADGHRGWIRRAELEPRQ